MDRLTIRDSQATTKENGVCCTRFNGEECKTWQGHCEQCSVNEAVWERLAQYEDSNLEPEAVAALMQVAAENRLLVLPAPAYGEGWCIHTCEDGTREILHATNLIPVMAFPVDGGWNVFSLDKIFASAEDAARALEMAQGKDQPQEDNIVPLRPKQEGSHGQDKNRGE